MKQVSSLFTKVVVSLTVAAIAIILSWQLADKSFSRLEEPLSKLADPYPPLDLVNSIFKDVVTLDVAQRSFNDNGDASELDTFIYIARNISNNLDSLAGWVSYDSMQSNRLLSMKELLSQKLALFEEYIQLNKDFEQYDAVKEQVQQLNHYIQKESILGGSNANKLVKEVTHVKKVQVIDSTAPKKRTLVDKVLGRNKNKGANQVKEETQEETLLVVDTQSLKKENKAIRNLGQAISSSEQHRTLQIQQLHSKRAELDYTASMLFNQFLETLVDIERAERDFNNANKRNAASIIEKGLNNSKVLLIGFSVLSIVLATLIFNDISKRNKYKKALIQAKEAAVQEAAAKQRFLSNMSHEIRTPLQSIIGYTELVHQEPNQEQQAHLLKVVHQSSLHLLHIVNEILDFSKVNSGKFSLDPTQFRLAEVVGQVADIIAVQAHRKHLQFEVKAPDLQQLPLLYGDAFRLKQILLNLLNNAIKFTQKGSVQLRLDTKKHQEEQIECEFEVVDTGVGITTKDQQKVFKAYEQVGQTAGKQGSGLGLSIVKELVELQGGRISLESTAGKGTHIRVCIPYALAEGTESAGQTSLNIAAQSPASLVWLIDDDAFILELCSKILAQNGIPFRSFGTPSEMLQADIPAELSHILTDIRMPELSGIELIAALKTKFDGKQAPRFVAMTAQVLPDELSLLLDAGFDTVLRKPFVVNELLQILGAVAPANSSTQHTVPTAAEEDELMQLFMQETQSDIAFLQAHNQLAHADSLAEVLHKMATRLSQFGYSAAGRKARQQELNLRQGKYDADAISALVEDVASLLAS